MSAFTDSKTTTMAPGSTESVSPKPTLEEVVALIQRDAAAQGIVVDTETAVYIDTMFAAVAEMISTPPYAKGYLLNPEDMLIAHPVLDSIMVDDVVVVAPGSAHNALNLRHLKDGQLTFVHTTAEGRGMDQYCAVAIGIDGTNAA